MKNSVPLKEPVSPAPSYELEQKLALLTINTEEPFILVDRDLNIVSYNHQFAEQYLTYFGVHVEKGQSILNYAQKGSSDALYEIYSRALKGQRHQLEMEVHSSDDRILTFLLKYKPAFDETGEIVGVFVSSTEISAMKRSQKLLIENENRFRSLINNANDIIYLTDKEGIISYISPAIERVTGFSPEELTGKSIFSILHPDQVKLSYKKLEELLENPGVTFLKTNQFLHKKGHYVWVEGSVTNLLNDPSVKAIAANYHDITHRKEAEEKLRQNEERLKAIIDNEPECVKVVDLSGNLLEMNAAGLKMLEADSLEQLKGRQVLELIHPEDRNMYLEIHQKSSRGEPCTGSFRVINLKQDIIWMETHSVPLRDSQEKIYAVLSVTRDATERKKAQERLETNEKRYRALVENAGDAISIIGAGGKQNYVSPSVKKVLGYTEEEALVLMMQDVVHPEDLPSMEQLLDQAIQNPGVKLPGHIARIRHKNGSWRWCESVMTNLSHDPFINGIVNNFRDVTEKILAEREREFDHTNLHALINNTNDLIWSISKDNRLISSNRAFNDMVRHLSGHDVVKGGDVPTAGFPEQQLKKWEHLYARAFSGESFTVIEYTNHKQELWSEISFYPIRQGEDIIGTACYSRDITDRKLSEKNIEAKTQELLIIKKELEYNELRLKQAQEIAHVGHWEVDFFTNISKWSDEAYRIYGLEPATHNFSPEQWKTFIHPEDLEGFELQIQRSSETHSNFSYSHRIVRPDGTIRSIVSEVRFEFDAFNKPIGLYGVAHDITEQKESEKQLQESHELLKKLTDKVPVAVYQFEMDKEGNMSFPFMSREIETLIPGLTIDAWDPDATSILQATHPDDIAKLSASIELSRANLSDWSLEFRIVARNNEVRWLNGYSKPEAKENGTTVWYGYLQDFTERKRVEEEIRLANERYDLLAKATNDAIWDWDLHTNNLYWGEGFTTLFGYNPQNEDLQGESWMEYIHPYDKKRVVESIRRSIHSRVTKQWQEEYRYIKADGSFANVLNRGYIIRDTAGEPLRMIGAMQDITQRKLAAEEIRITKERYDFVAKATNDAIYDWDLVTGVTLRSGDGLKTLFGYDPKDAIEEPQFWAKRIHPDDIEMCYSKLMQLLNDPEANYCTQEYRFLKSDGSYAYVYDKGFIMRDTHGKAIRLIGATQDITKTKEAEFQLKELNESLAKRAEELAVSNLELEQFAYIASHDLQEPLRMITSFLTRLEAKYKDALDDKAKQYIHFATDGAIRMRRLILDLLEYSRAGRQMRVKTQLDMDKLLSDALRLNKVAIQEKQALIGWKDLPVIVGSETALLQVFQNLIANALKYQREGTLPTVSISAKDTGTHWQFSVSDNGIGIEERYFEKIFVVFQRLHNKDDYSGTGIGLAICKKIIDNHQGHIWVESTFGKGSTFHFTISKSNECRSKELIS